MDGAVLRRERDIDLGIVTAWHTASFALGMYAGKLKGKTLSDFLIATPASAKPRRSQWADAHAFFGRLKARGVPIETRH
jgi:hypothetical protein